MFVLLASTLLIQATVALIGYNCGSRSYSIKKMSLLDVGQYQVPSGSLNVTRKYIKLLQNDEFVETRAIQCKLEIHRTIYYSGMYSHISIVKHEEHDYIYDINKEACEQLYETGLIRFNNHVISGIWLNSTTIHPMVYAGYVNNDGKCNGAAYSDPYGE